MTFLTSGVCGILTGLLGPIIKGWMQIKQQKTDNEHEQKMVGLESAASIAEVEAGIKRDKIQTEGRIDEATISAMGKALESADKSIFKEEYIKYLVELTPVWGEKSLIGPMLAAIVIFAIAFVDLLRQAIRPSLTIYLVGATTWITILSYKILSLTTEALTADFAQEIFLLVIQTIIYLTVSAVTFWFCDRAKDLKAKISNWIK